MSDLQPDRDLSKLAPKFRAAVQASLAECQAAGLDAVVQEAMRSPALQASYYAQGRTRPGPIVTNAPDSLHSWHGYGLAVDVVSQNRGWSVAVTWWASVADIFKRHGLTWGGDWHMKDLPHFQWGACRPSPSDVARQLLALHGLTSVWEAVGAIERATVQRRAA